MCDHRTRNLLILRSPQLSFTSGPWRSCWHESVDDTRTSLLQAKGRQCYLSQNIGLAVTRSAGPALPPLPNNPDEKSIQTIVI